MESWSNTERPSEGHGVEQTKFLEAQTGDPEIHSMRATRSTLSLPGPPTDISLWSNIRLQILIWHCGLLYRILQGFVYIAIVSPTFQLDISSGHGPYLLSMTVSFAGTLGCCFAVTLMIKAGVAPITQVSLFITGTLIFIMSFFYKPDATSGGYGRRDTISLEGPSDWYSIAITVGCSVSGLTSSALTPAAFLLIASSCPQQTQPIFLFVWGAMGLVGDIAIELIFVATSSDEIYWLPIVNVAMAIQGLYFTAFSLRVDVLLDTTIYQTISFRSINSSSDTSFGPITYHKYAPQLLATFKDPHAYFFLMISIFDGFIEPQFRTAFCILPSIYSKLAATSLHVVCGLALYKFSQLRITLLVISVSLNMVFLSFEKDHSVIMYFECFTRDFWVPAIAAGLGNLPIICTASLFPANVSGSLRRAIIVAIICTGYRLGPMFEGEKTVLPLFICSGVMILAAAFYGAWLFCQNKKKSKVIAELGLSEGESMRLNSIAIDSGMTDIENIHYRYCF